MQQLITIIVNNCLIHFNSSYYNEKSKPKEDYIVFIKRILNQKIN